MNLSRQECSGRQAILLSSVIQGVTRNGNPMVFTHVIQHRAGNTPPALTVD